MKAWKIKHQRSANESLWQALLSAREIENPGDFFASASYDDLHDPFLFDDMQKAVDRIMKAIQSKERLVVYGDYDVDGTSGSAILIHTLRMLGGEVSYRIPHRRNDGYGLHNHFIEEVSEKGASVLITVDCGISCPEQVELANTKNLDIIITDHHTVPEKLPEAFAILHPGLSPKYPFKHLAGSGVAFKLACGLLIHTNNEDFIPGLTDLASLGTVADCVPLQGENRSIVKLGLKQMLDTKWDGLKAILQSAGQWGQPEFTSETIGFQIGPRINASGRIDSPYWAMQALLSTGLEAMDKAMKLEQLNHARRELTRKIQEEAEAVIDSSQPLLMASHPEWPSGIVGLIAGRLQEKHGKPAFIMEERGEFVVGSARSLPGFHCVDAIKSSAHLLENFGGHRQAAGFRLKSDNLDDFVKSMQAYAADFFKNTPIELSLDVDLHLKEEDLSLESIDRLSSFAPYGIGNPMPLFVMETVEVMSSRPVGSTGDHLKFTIKFGDKIIDGIGFQFGKQQESFENAKDLVVELDINEWNGARKPQVKLVDFR
jgi:single-stranded-DNA-specific exonuclease